MTAEYGNPFRRIAAGGGISAMYRVIDMINTGHDTAEIESWCRKEIIRLNNIKQTGELDWRSIADKYNARARALFPRLHGDVRDGSYPA